jgi:hypothetical protein
MTYILGENMEGNGKDITFLIEMQTARLSNYSNVFILESLDPVRIKFVLDKAKDGSFDKLFKTPYQNIIHYNIQRDEMKNLKTGQNLQPNMEYSRLKELDTMLLGTKTLVIVDYAYSQVNVDPMFENMLVAWSQDNVMFDKNSTVIIFTGDLNLFNEILRRRCFTASIVASTPAERMAILSETAKNIEETFAVSHKGTALKKIIINEEMIQSSGGLNLHDVETAALQGFYGSEKRQFELATFTDYKVKILKEVGIEFIIPKFGYAMVGGEELNKQYTQDNICMPLRNPEIAAKYGVGIPKGMIICGLPGTGKGT